MNTHIDIKTFPKFEPEYSIESEGKYYYSYRICLKNMDAEPCQLISRRWLITDANGRQQEVIGDGVIGKQPVLKQGRQFSYTSGCLLKTPVGTMEGYYIMRTSSGREFRSIVKPFLLAVPDSIN